MMGAEAIRHLLSAIELETLAKELLSQMESPDCVSLVNPPILTMQITHSIQRQSHVL